MTAFDFGVAEVPLPAAPPHDGRAQRFLHWSMAAIVIAAMLIGLYRAYQAPGTPVRRRPMRSGWAG